MTNNLRSNVRPVPTGGGRRFLWSRMAVPAVSCAAVLVLGLILPMAGCDASKGPARAPGVAPMPTYTGPAYLRGTVGSLVRLRQGTDQPMLVNGYGLVVNLNGTGSTSAPPALRQALINQMKKYGLGSVSMGTQGLSPERVLADPNTAVVRIDGLIPPGASPDMRFDVLVSSIDSQTTSLAGGTLWTATLGVDGAQQAFKFVREQAKAYGPIYDNPYHDSPVSGEPREFGRKQAIVAAGGKVTESRDLELVLNQSSYSRCRAIADRINERFGMATDRQPLAKPLTDQLIKISVPLRYQSNPGQMVELMMHLYLQTGPGFEPQQARRLAEVLREQPEAERSVRLAWQALGRPVVEVLREYYQDPQISMRLAALEAGAWLDDERASQYLSELANDTDPGFRARVAKVLALLPRSIKGARTLKMLLDDEDTAVQITAYESLSAINDRLITDGRVVVADEMGTRVKYVIDVVPAKRPLVYVTQVGVPRIAVFGSELGFKPPLLARLWDNRLMLSMPPEQGYVEIFYQPFVRSGPDAASSIKLKAVPNLKTLIYLLGHRPTAELPSEGLDLTYSQVVDVVYQLCRQGHIEAPIEVVVTPLAKQIADMENSQNIQQRPETGEAPVGDGGLSTDNPGLAPVPAVRPDTATQPGDAPQASSR
jgi:Flagellar P-ring protein/HEAT repeats